MFLCTFLERENIVESRTGLHLSLRGLDAEIIAIKDWWSPYTCCDLMHGTMFCWRGSSRRQINTFMLANYDSRHGGHNSIDVFLAVYSFKLIVLLKSASASVRELGVSPPAHRCASGVRGMCDQAHTGVRPYARRTPVCDPCATDNHWCASGFRVVCDRSVLLGEVASDA